MDTIFDVLSNERRRRLLRYLDASDGTVTIGELAEMLAERESDDGSYDNQARKRTYVALSQSHLPKMADIGIVEYDSQSKRVRLAPAFDHVEPYLYDSVKTPVQRNYLYLAAGLVGVGIVGSGYLWSSTGGSIPTEAWAGMLVAICGFLVAACLVRSTEWIGVEWFRA